MVRIIIPKYDEYRVSYSKDLTKSYHKFGIKKTREKLYFNEFSCMITLAIVHKQPEIYQKTIH